ncbi:MAG: chemotaxis protein CheA [Actinomycetota bacterium]
MDFEDDLVHDFLVESHEMLDQLDESFVELEEDPENTEVIGGIFRVMHTIKGASGFLGFENLEKLCHRSENVLTLLRDQAMTLDTEIANVLLASVDRTRQILAMVEDTGSDTGVEIEDLVEVLTGIINAPSSGDADTEAGDAEDSGDADTEAAPEAELRPDAVVFFDAPAPKRAAAPTGDTAEDAAEEVADGGDAPEAAAADEPAAAATEPAADRIGDILVEEHGVDRTAVEFAASQQALGDDRPIGSVLADQGDAAANDVDTAVETQKAKRRSASESTIRVDVDLLDDLMNLIGELVLTRNEILQFITDASDRGLAQSSQRLDLLTSELQDKVMTTRMQPIGSVWSKLPRVVRDLAQQCGKQVRIEMDGKETELDKSLIETMKDPLTHIVRNTVDHGIEPPEKRAEAGKPEEGVLKLSAGHQDGHVVITIADDGGGIDLDRVRAKAVERQLITEDEAANMPDSEATRLIMLPGFSTAATITNVSGRGVGMDVVQTNIEKIGGSVDITTRKGEGTTFRIEIPLTLAIVPALVVVCADRRYAIPQRSLVELVSIDNTPIGHSVEYIHDAPVIRLRDRLLPVLDLRTALEEEERESLVGDMVVLNADGSEFALLVDEIVETQEIVVKPLGQVIHETEIFSGATILGDGRVALILDVVGLGQQAQVIRGRVASAGGPDMAVESETGHGSMGSLLLLSVGGDRQIAMSLSDVERLDEFKVDDIETAGHSHVVQYRSEIMPIIDLGSELGYGAGELGANNGVVSVVVYRHHDRDIGLMIDQVIDIVDIDQAEKTASGNMIIRGRVTEMIDVGQLPTLAILDIEEPMIGALQ